MPPNAQVIIFNDDPKWTNYAKEFLPDDGHTIVGIAGDLESLENLLKTESAKKADVILLDNIAPRRQGEKVDIKGVGIEAETMTRNYLGENVIIIATTSADTANYGEEHFTGSTSQLGEFITAFPAKER